MKHPVVRRIADVLCRWRPIYGHRWYSQEGEDILLNKLLHGVSRGSFIDVGCHHPQRFSNTYHFYRKGWRGINIDPLPGTRRRFEWARPGDVTLEVAIAAQASTATYFSFDEPALNTFSKEIADRRIADGQRLRSATMVPMRPLRDIYAEQARRFPRIDFMSIDVEGFELEVLRSIDWSALRPRVIVIEYLDSTLEQALGSDLARDLAQQRYRLQGKLVQSLFFIAE
jgi:FkbM family methyltransferase